jgi:hypothetical protein
MQLKAHVQSNDQGLLNLVKLACALARDDRRKRFELAKQAAVLLLTGKKDFSQVLDGLAMHLMAQSERIKAYDYAQEDLFVPMNRTVALRTMEGFYSRGATICRDRATAVCEESASQEVIDSRRSRPIGFGQMRRILRYVSSGESKVRNDVFQEGDVYATVSEMAPVLDCTRVEASLLPNFSPAAWLIRKAVSQDGRQPL